MSDNEVTLDVDAVFAKVGRLVMVNEAQAQLIDLLRERVAELEAQLGGGPAPG